MGTWCEAKGSFFSGLSILKGTKRKPPGSFAWLLLLNEKLLEGCWNCDSSPKLLSIKGSGKSPNEVVDVGLERRRRSVKEVRSLAVDVGRRKWWVIGKIIQIGEKVVVLCSVDTGDRIVCGGKRFWMFNNNED